MTSKKTMTPALTKQGRLSPAIKGPKHKWQTDLLLKTWEESGKVYGYRKLHDDLLDRGEMCCPNRVARLISLAGIKAQIGYKRRHQAAQREKA